MQAQQMKHDVYFFHCICKLKISLIQKKIRKKYSSVDIYSNVFLKQGIKLLYRKFTVHNAPGHFLNTWSSIFLSTCREISMPFQPQQLL